MKILLAGEDPAPGSARYLLAVLKAMHATAVHVSSRQRMSARMFRQRYAAILLSDFPSIQAPLSAQQALAEQVRDGTGLLMIGGWASFSGPFGGWHGSLIERLLPVTCQDHDDRINFPSGALLVSKATHAIWGGLSFAHPPIICGLNQVQPTRHSRVLLSARPLLTRSHRGLPQVRVSPKEYPLLVIGTQPDRRVAAFATDAAPHWCGGLVDWGERSVRLPVTKRIHAEVGDRYVRLFSCLLRWAARAPSA